MEEHERDSSSIESTEITFSIRRIKAANSGSRGRLWAVLACISTLASTAMIIYWLLT